MNNRYKPVGWRYESHKHSLASKGIATKYTANKYFSPFKVEYLDDQDSPKRWKTANIGFEGDNVDRRTGKILDEELYRAQLGHVQPTVIKETDSHQEAEDKLAALRADGWKARIVETKKDYDSRNNYNAVKWEGSDSNDVVEWQDPQEFVRRTHGTNIEDVPFSAPHYSDSERGTRPAHELVDVFRKGESAVPILEDWVDPKYVTYENGKKIIPGNKAHIDGRHRAWAAWFTNEQKIPVIVGKKVYSE